MRISIKLVGLFQTGRFKQQECDYPSGTTVDDVVADLQLPRQHFGIVLINGKHAQGGTVLEDGDRLVLMPIVDGG
jgi:sulfur carrier protein ThiS